MRSSRPENIRVLRFSRQSTRCRDVGARFDGTVTFHDGCHGLRELGIESQPRQLLKHVQGLTLVEMKEAKTCCGFGGTFSVKFPAISTAMAR